MAQLHHWDSKLRSGSGGIRSREIVRDQIPKGLGKGFGLALEETAEATWSYMNLQGGSSSLKKALGSHSALQGWTRAKGRRGREAHQDTITFVQGEVIRPEPGESKGGEKRFRIL